MRRYRIADDVAWVSREDLDTGGQPTAYVARLPSGPPMTLDGSACLVWLALADGGTHEEITHAAAEMSTASPDDVRDDVASVIAQLVAAGVVATS